MKENTKSEKKLINFFEKKSLKKDKNTFIS